MKGEGHLGEKRDKTVYFTSLWGQGVYIFAVQLGSCLFVCLFVWMLGWLFTCLLG